MIFFRSFLVKVGGQAIKLLNIFVRQQMIVPPSEFRSHNFLYRDHVSLFLDQMLVLILFYILKLETSWSWFHTSIIARWIR